MLKKYPDQDADFSGRLLGGCLDCLVNLKGTEFDKTVEFVEKYKEDGIICSWRPANSMCSVLGELFGSWITRDGSSTRKDF